MQTWRDLIYAGVLLLFAVPAFVRWSLGEPTRKKVHASQDTYWLELIVSFLVAAYVILLLIEFLLEFR